MGQAKARKAEIETLKAEKFAFRKDLGQVMTPFPLVKEILDQIDTFKEPTDKLMWKTFLEPSYGDGAFVMGTIRKLMDSYAKSTPNAFLAPNGEWKQNALNHILQVQVFGVEIDPVIRERAIANVRLLIEALGYDFTALDAASVPFNHNLALGNVLDGDVTATLVKQMSTWQAPFFVKTMHMLRVATKFKLPGMAVGSMFKPDEQAAFTATCK